MIRNIIFPTPLDLIEDKENDNIDVIIELMDGITLTLVVSTPQNIIWYMEKENTLFIPAQYPDIIVKALSEEIILAALQDYVQEKTKWMKISYLASVNEDFFDLHAINKALLKVSNL